MKNVSSHNVILDVSGNRIILNEESNPLSKSECFLIKYLYERQGVLISKDELTQRCWPGRVVSATSLPVAIKHIRDVLRKIKNEEIIKTHKGEGYSFIPGVIEMKIIDAHPGDEITSTKKAVKTKYNKLQILDFLTVIKMVTGVFLVWGVGFVIYTKYLNNIRCWHTNSGLLIISTSEITSESSYTFHEGDSIFIDDMDSTLICDKLTCNFIK